MSSPVEPRKVHLAIESATASLRGNVDYAVASIEGVYSSTIKAYRSLGGLQQFQIQTQSLRPVFTDAVAGAVSRFKSFVSSVIDPRLMDTDALEAAVEHAAAYFDVARAAAARRYRIELISRQTSAPRAALRVLNRAGQSHAAGDMMFLTLRKGLIDLYNDAAARQRREQGYQDAVVSSAQPHRFDGVALSIDPGQNGYWEVRDEWFHPRSNLILTV